MMELLHLLNLNGKVAIVTGASGALGAASARALVSVGAKVILVSRDRHKLCPLVKEFGSRSAVMEGDVSLIGEADRIVERVADEYGRVDILVNAAGGASVGGLMDLDDETWQANLDLKLLGYMRMMRAAARVMRRLGGGKIINIIGLAGHEPYHLLTAPSVVDAGLLALTKSAADELASDNILVNAVNPNAAETRLGGHMIGELAKAQGVTSQNAHCSLVGSTPLKRLARSDDVAASVLFYATDLSAFITGTSMTIDGGAHRAIA
jgi:NAD(P)-dependent dehydrogenase (short-subunit alcohol dehydrogenase family)